MAIPAGLLKSACFVGTHRSNSHDTSCGPAWRLVPSMNAGISRVSHYCVDGLETASQPRARGRAGSLAQGWRKHSIWRDHACIQVFSNPEMIDAIGEVSGDGAWARDSDPKKVRIQSTRHVGAHSSSATTICWCAWYTSAVRGQFSQYIHVRAIVDMTARASSDLSDCNSLPRKTSVRYEFSFSLPSYLLDHPELATDFGRYIRQE